MYVNVRACVCVYVCVYTYIYTHTAYVYVYVCVYVLYEYAVLCGERMVSCKMTELLYVQDVCKSQKYKALRI